MAAGERTHPRQPLSVLFHHDLYSWTRGLFEAPGRASWQVAFDTTALGSVLAGVLFVFVAVGLSREMVRVTSGAPQESSHDRSAPAALGVAVAGLVLTQGYVQLCFGYVENYTFFLLTIGVYLLAGLRVAAGRTSLIFCSIPLILSIGLNLSGVVLLPSWLVLALVSLRGQGRWRTALEVVATLLMLAGLGALLTVLDPQEGPGSALRYMWGIVVEGTHSANSVAYLFSREHLRDFANLHMLLGPFAALLLAPLFFFHLAGPWPPRRLFLISAALPPLVASWLLGDPLQGFPRDWDLFAPFGVTYVLGGLDYVLGGVRPARLNRMLWVAVAVSVFHTAPWVALNTSESMALERYKTFPISRGRAEAVVGMWYVKHGDKPAAKEWLTRAVQVNPGNNTAHYLLGLYAMDESRYEDALVHFEIALHVRPDHQPYRLSVADALMMLGRPGRALPELKWLIEADPKRPSYWACYGVALLGVRHSAEAQAAFDTAVDLAPRDSLYLALKRAAPNPGAFERAMEESWVYLVTR